MAASFFIKLRTSLVAVICFASCGIAVAQTAAEQRQARIEKFRILQAEFKQLREQVQADKIQLDLEKVFEKKILHLVAAHKLSGAQADRLRVAAKGAARQHQKAQHVEGIDLPVWAADFSGYYHRSGELVFVGEWKKSLALEQPIWINAMNEVIAPDEMQEQRDRAEFKLRVVIDNCIYQLDGKLKLKLKLKLRAAIRELIESGIGKELRSFRCESRRMFCYPPAHFLSELTDEKLRELLTDQQVEKWPQVMELILP